MQYKLSKIHKPAKIIGDLDYCFFDLWDQNGHRIFCYGAYGAKNIKKYDELFEEVLKILEQENV